METRRAQLRAAKHRQREKDREAGRVLYQLKLPIELRDRLKAGMMNAAFVERLHAFLRHELIRVDDYPGLALLCWNRGQEYVTREDALRTYEINWRLVDITTLGADEAALIDELKEEFGSGVLNA